MIFKILLLFQLQQMAKRNSVGSMQRNLQSSKNFQPAYGTAVDDEVNIGLNLKYG